MKKENWWYGKMKLDISWKTLLGGLIIADAIRPGVEITTTVEDDSKEEKEKKDEGSNSSSKRNRKTQRNK